MADTAQTTAEYLRLAELEKQKQLAASGGTNVAGLSGYGKNFNVDPHESDKPPGPAPVAAPIAPKIPDGSPPVGGPLLGAAGIITPGQTPPMEGAVPGGTHSTPGGIHATAAPANPWDASPEQSAAAGLVPGFGAIEGLVDFMNQSPAAGTGVDTSDYPDLSTTPGGFPIKPLSSNLSALVPGMGGAGSAGASGGSGGNLPANFGGGSGGGTFGGAGSSGAGGSGGNGPLGLGGYGAGGAGSNYPPPASTTASPPNSVWTADDTAARAAAMSPLPPSYTGPAVYPQGGGGGYGGYGGLGGYGGGGATFSPPAAPEAGTFNPTSKDGAAYSSSGATSSSSTQTSAGGRTTTTSSGTAAPGQSGPAGAPPAAGGQGSAAPGGGGPQLPPEKQSAAELEAQTQWQAGQDALAADKPAGAVDGLAAEYQKALDAANAKNEERYSQGVSGYVARRERSLDALDTQTDQDFKDLAAQYNQQRGQTQQSLMNRGLGNTTVRDSIERGINTGEAAARNRLQDSRLQQKIGLDTSLDRDTLETILGRTDAAPDLSQLAMLSQLIGAGGNKTLEELLKV